MVSEVSILIPIYNFAIEKLVKELLAQCKKAGVRFEIICLDDASEPEFKEKNRKLKNLENVLYEELPVNISRAAIRNQLAQRAQHLYLLFLDNDSQLVSEVFIQNYLNAADEKSILIGGTVYQPYSPAPLYHLHWEYGRRKEQRPALIRQQKPYQQLQINNLFIFREIFLANSIPELLQTYGHEDTLWGYQLEKANVPIKHINNPVRHAGLETAPVFLQKTEKAVKNMVVIFSIPEDIKFDSSLVTSYLLVKKLGLVGLFQTIFKYTKSLILKQLLSVTPKLFFLDILKLGLFINEMQRIKNNTEQNY